jgi:hypothetical protein
MPPDAEVPIEQQSRPAPEGSVDPTVGLTTSAWLEGVRRVRRPPARRHPIDAWPELLAAVPGPGGPLDVTVTTVVERDPDACTLWRVLVEEVSFGDGPRRSACGRRCCAR